MLRGLRTSYGSVKGVLQRIKKREMFDIRLRRETREDKSFKTNASCYGEPMFSKIEICRCTD